METTGIGPKKRHSVVSSRFPLRIRHAKYDRMSFLQPSRGGTMQDLIEQARIDLDNARHLLEVYGYAAK